MPEYFPKNVRYICFSINILILSKYLTRKRELIVARFPSDSGAYPVMRRVSLPRCAPLRPALPRSAPLYARAD